LQIRKFNYYRSKKHLKNVASLDCQICGATGFIQAAHSNQMQHGKGRGIKSSDEYTAALCLKCHYEIDQGKELSKEERQEKWHHAHIATVAKLFNDGNWPVDVPIPTFTIDVQLSHSQGH
jgi:hypothetical protein